MPIRMNGVIDVYTGIHTGKVVHGMVIEGLGASIDRATNRYACMHGSVDPLNTCTITCKYGCTDGQVQCKSMDLL